MSIAAQTKELCQRYDIHPARSKGQNFLIQEHIYDKILAAAELAPTDVVLEVGPGLGFLTERLARIVRHVVAVELDGKLAYALQKRLSKLHITNVTVVNEDILKIPDTKYQILNTHYKIVANLPYNITSRFLRKFLAEVALRPTHLVLMLQYEVAQRLSATPGEMSLLAVSVQRYADVHIAARVSKEAFWPAPKVESAIVSLKVYNVTKFIKSEEDNFFRLVKAGFSAKRKQLSGNVSNAFHLKRADVDTMLEECGFAKTIRAQELSMVDWQNLYVVLRKQNMV